MRPRRRARLVRAVPAVLLVVTGVVACSGDGESPGSSESSDPAQPSSESPSQPETSPTEGEQADREPTAQRIGRLFFGMHEGRISGGVLPDAPIGSVRLWDTGTAWSQVELTAGDFFWGPIDTAVGTAERRGLRPVLVLGQSPTFHASKPAEQGAYGAGAASMPDLDAWRRYVSATAARYGDRVDYQIWNETNIVEYWSGTPAQMEQLTITGSRAIRAEVPRATVVAPSFALRKPGQRRYFEQFWGRGKDLVSAVDVVAVHLYPLAEDGPETQLDLLEGAREVLSEAGADQPVWNAEINYGLLGGATPTPIPEERQRAFLMRTYLLNAGAGIERVYWYRWDIGRIANTYLTEEDLTTETLAGRSFDVVRDWLEGARVDDCVSDSDGVWECAATQGGKRRLFLWTTGGKPARVPVPEARSWTDATGGVTRCGRVCRVPVDETPVMVTW